MNWSSSVSYSEYGPHNQVVLILAIHFSEIFTLFGTEDMLETDKVFTSNISYIYQCRKLQLRDHT